MGSRPFANASCPLQLSHLRTRNRRGQQASRAPAHTAAQQSKNRKSSVVAGQQANSAAQPSRDEIELTQQALDRKGSTSVPTVSLGPRASGAEQVPAAAGCSRRARDQQTMSALGIPQTGSTTGQGGSSGAGANAALIGDEEVPPS